MTERAIVRFLLLVNLLFGLFYVFAKPPWQGYDEPQHVEIVMLLEKDFSHPMFNRSGWWNVSEEQRYDLEKQIIQSMLRYRFWTIHKLPSPEMDLSFKSIFKGANEYHQPPLYYLFCALISRGLSLTDPVSFQYLCRILSVLLITCGLWIFSGWLPLVFPSDRNLRLAALALLALSPMHANLSASVNNDAMVELIGMIFLGLLCRIRTREKVSSLSFMGVIVTLSAGILCKATFPVLSVLLLVLIYQLLIRHTRSDRYLGFILKVGMIFLGSIATFLFHFSDKYNVYQLIRLPLRVLESAQLTSLPLSSAPRSFMGFIIFFYQSAVGVLVYGHEYLATWIYVVGAIICSCSLIGWLAMRRIPNSKNQSTRDIQTLLMLAILLTTIQTGIKYFINGSYFGDAHFRYAALGYGAWACCFIMGFARVSRQVFPKWLTPFHLITTICLLHHLVFVFWYFIPLFYLQLFR